MTVEEDFSAANFCALLSMEKSSLCTSPFILSVVVRPNSMRFYCDSQHFKCVVLQRLGQYLLQFSHLRGGFALPVRPHLDIHLDITVLIVNPW